MSAPPVVAPRPAQPVRLAAGLLVAALAAAWALALADSPWAQVPILAAAVLLLLRPPSSATGLILGGGLLTLGVLVAKDFWPVAPAWANLPALPWSEGWPRPTQRNPQIWPLLTQAGALAALILGVATLQQAHAEGVISRRRWLELLAALLTAWSLAVLLHTASGQPYSTEHALLAVTNKNAAATLSALGTVLALGLAWLTWQRRNLWSCVLWLLATTLGALALVNLNSWTGVAALLGGGLVLGASLSHGHRSRHRHVLWLWLLTAAAIGALVIQSGTLTARMADLHQDYRLRIWRDCLALIADFPLGGAGLGSFPGVYPLYGRLDLVADSRLLHPDSSWVLLAVEWGLPATLLLGAAAVALLVRRPPETNPDPGAAALAITRAGVTAWLVAGISDVALHRPAVALVGASLVALLPWPSLPRLRWPRWLQIVAVALALAVVAAGVQATIARHAAGARTGFNPAHLQRDPLNARLHWLAALDSWNRRGDTAAALAHFRTAVRLDHRSMRLAETAARLLTPARPAEAAGFWTEALRRSRHDRGLGRGMLQQAWREFPALPTSYWEDVVTEGNPALLALVAGRPDAARTRLLWRWWRAVGPAGFHAPDQSDDFFAALRQLPPGHPLLPAILREHPTGLGLEFYLRAARHLHTEGRDTIAWRALSLQSPFAGLLGGSDTAESDPRFRHWQQLLGDLAQRGEHRARLRLLEEICRQPKPPPVFRAQLAQALFDTGHADEAVARLLEMAAPKPAR